MPRVGIFIGICRRFHWCSDDKSIGSTAELLAAVKECGKRRDLTRGKTLHWLAFEAGYYANKYVSNALISMYSKCRSMTDAQAVFDKMTKRDAVSWTNVILGYVENGDSSVAMGLFTSMDCEPDSVTFVAVLKACACLATERRLNRHFFLEKGMGIHRQASERGYDTDIFVSSALVEMYRKCGCMQHARAVFEKMARRDAVLWTTLIIGYVENEQRLEALALFESMDCEPDRVTFIAALKACASVTQLEKGMAIHRRAKERGFDTDILLASTLVDMYSKCGSMQLAQGVFDNMTRRNVVSWNSLILGYAENGQYTRAMELFEKMDCKPDTYTLVAALKACAGLLCLEKGIAIHEQAKEYGFDRDAFVANTMMEMYIRCGSIPHARSVFDSMVVRDTVSWNILILGYVENLESVSAMELFMSMDCKPNSFTFAAALKACVGRPRDGQCIHAHICKLGLEQDQVAANCLVDFYGKCGTMVAAEHVFNSMHSWKSTVSWNALIAGYSSVGDTAHVFRFIREMQEAGVQVDGITSVLILTACSHAGMVDIGKKYFECMPVYGMVRTMEHYACVVDMLGRANRLQEALLIIKNMPFEANSVVWMSLLSACSSFVNLEVGKVAFDALVRFNNVDAAAAYGLMDDIYKKLGMLQRLEQKEGEKSTERTGECKLNSQWKLHV